MAKKVAGKSKGVSCVNIYRLKTGKGAPVTKEAMKMKSDEKQKKMVQAKSVSKPPGSGGPSMIAKVPHQCESKKSANVKDTPISGIRKRKYSPPETFEDVGETMVELVDLFKVENEELRKEVATLKEAVDEKMTENIKMKLESENQKKMISSLTDLVSDLKKEIKKKTSSKVTKPDVDLKQDQNSKAADCLTNKLNLKSLPQLDTSFRKKVGTGKAPEKSIRKNLFLTPQKVSVKARKLKENVNQTPFDVSRLDVSSLDSSYCSVFKKTDVQKYKRVDEDISVPRVKFSIVTEEKDENGREIAKLQCAMRPETLIRQVKKSYCKKMGLDRDKMELKLLGLTDVNQNIVSLKDENTVSGLEGAIVAAVRVDNATKDSKVI